VLNSVKHNVDDLYNLPNSKADPRLTELLALTLGFKVKRNYDKAQLTALVSILPIILKNKGTKKAVVMAGEALITASGATGTFSCEIENNSLIVTLPKDLVDTTLFIDLLPYILPAGMTCRILRKNITEKTIKTVVTYKDTNKLEVVKDINWDSDDKAFTGLSLLFANAAEARAHNRDVVAPEFSNFAYKADGVLNTGLLNNTLITSLEPDTLNINDSREEEPKV
jgi:hypothetical protein